MGVVQLEETEVGQGQTLSSAPEPSSGEGPAYGEDPRGALRPREDHTEGDQLSADPRTGPSMRQRVCGSVSLQPQPELSWTLGALSCQGGSGETTGGGETRGHSKVQRVRDAPPSQGTGGQPLAAA